MKRCFCLLIVCLIICSSEARSLYRASSPDNNVCFMLDEVRQGGITSLQYYVTMGGKTVVAPSQLGLVMDGVVYGQKVPQPEVQKRVIDETYTLKSGKQLLTRNYCNEYTLTFKDKTKMTFQLIVRVYNTGVAFRYAFPETDKKFHIIQKEMT